MHIKIETLNSKTNDVDSFVDELKKSISANSPQNITIDLRGNNGGSEVAFEANENSESFYKLIEGANVVTYVDERTFSSASKVMQKLKMHGSKVVGETIGQTENHFGDCKLIKIPNTDVKVFCSTKEYVLVGGKHYGLSKNGNYTYEDAKKHGITMDMIKQRKNFELDYHVQISKPKAFSSDAGGIKK